MLGNSLQTALDEAHFTVNLYSFPLHPSPPDKTFLPPGNSFTSSLVEQLPKPPTPTSPLAAPDIPLVCIFSSIMKSGIFNNEGMKENIELLEAILFCHQKINAKADKLCMKFS